MSNGIATRQLSQNLPLEEEKRGLEHQVLRGIVESDEFVISPETQGAVIKLRELCKRPPSAEQVQPKEAVLATFVTILITTFIALVGKGIEELLRQPAGFATVFNPGPPIRVWTYDETDGVRWIAFREYSIGTNEAVPLTARGNNAIQVVVIGKPNVHTLGKGQSFAYDGNVMLPRTA
jgi:hypothetical protein